MVGCQNESVKLNIKGTGKIWTCICHIHCNGIAFLIPENTCSFSVMLNNERKTKDLGNKVRDKRS
jgi:hypothetical protein